MTELTWQPICSFDALPQKKRPRLAAFFYPAEPSGRAQLPETVQFQRTYGRRTCTLWMPIPHPSEQAGIRA